MQRLQGEYAAHLVVCAIDKGGAVVAALGLVANVHADAVVVLRTREDGSGTVVSVHRVRGRAAKFTVTDARQALAAVIGKVHMPEASFFRIRDTDVRQQVIRVGEHRLAAGGVGDFRDAALLFVAGDVLVGHFVAQGIAHRDQPGQARLADVEAHAVVFFVADDDITVRIVEIQLQIHALFVLERLRAFMLEIMQSPVAIFPHEVVELVVFLPRDLLVGARLPALAAGVVVRVRETGIVVVADRNRHEVAGHRSVGMVEHHVAVKQVGVDRAGAAGRAALVLPPAFEARVTHVIEVQDRLAVSSGVGGVQLRVVGPDDVPRGMERDAEVLAVATFIRHAPLTVEVGDVELDGNVARSRAFLAFDGVLTHFALIVRVEIRPRDVGLIPIAVDRVDADVVGRRTVFGIHPQLGLNDRIRSLQRCKFKEAEHAYALLAVVRAQLDVILRLVVRKALAIRQAGEFGILVGVRRADQRVDGHRERGLRKGFLVQFVVHAHAIAHGGQHDGSRDLGVFSVVDVGRLKDVITLARHLVTDRHTAIIHGLVVIGVRQAQGGMGPRRSIGKDQILLERLAVQGVAHAQAGQDVFIDCVAVHGGSEVRALFRLGFEDGEVGLFKACAGAAHEEGRRLRARYQPRLFDLRALAHHRRDCRGHAVQRPFQHVAAAFDARQLAAVRALAQLHAQRVGAVAKDGPAGSVRRVLEVVVDVLPPVAVFLIVDGFRENDRLIAAVAEMELLDVLAAFFEDFVASRLLEQFRAPLEHFLLVALAHGHRVFHDGVSFLMSLKEMSCCRSCLLQVLCVSPGLPSWEVSLPVMASSFWWIFSIPSSMLPLSRSIMVWYFSSRSLFSLSMRKNR